MKSLTLIRKQNRTWSRPRADEIADIASESQCRDFVLNFWRSWQFLDIIYILQARIFQYGLVPKNVAGRKKTENGVSGYIVNSIRMLVGFGTYNGIFLSFYLLNSAAFPYKNAERSHSCRDVYAVYIGISRHPPFATQNLWLSRCTSSFDKPGYGESDPDPKRKPKSLALDIEELADQLGLGTKFYVVVDHLEVDCSNKLDLGEEDIAALDGSVAGQDNKKAVHLLVDLPKVLGGKVALKEVEGGGGGVGGCGGGGVNGGGGGK
ncbi:hypothetical protein NL676_037425 [Syzygium grande]|nr:hypothetical protein NL676_037425 [Syzygium grande]